jgi:hypothetical protein
MERRKILAILVLVLGLMVCQVKVSEAAEMGTAFTYQGRLIDANNAADGLYDFRFKLYDDANVVDSNQVGGDVNKPDVDVVDGYFTVELDFGSEVFDGNAVWLEIGVRPGRMYDPNLYTTLTPRQELTPVPYALHTRGVFVSNLNTFVGLDAGRSNGAGHSNTLLGHSAGFSNTAGNYNTFLGDDAGRSNTTGNYNTFSGYMAGYYNTTAYGNTFSGGWAGYSNTTGNFNTFLGNDAGFSNTTGKNNTFSGGGAGRNNSTGHSNTFSGYYAGSSNTTANYNTFSGYRAGFSNTTGHSNTISGSNAGFSNTTGYDNTFVGDDAGRFNTTGNANTFLGDDAGRSNTTGESNTFSGSDAGYSNTTGYSNTFLGDHAGSSNTTGSYNTFSGYRAGYSNATGRRNVFIGYAAGFSETRSNKLYIANDVPDANVLIYGDFSTGKVGIGVMDPCEDLDVAGTARLRGISNGTGSPVLQLRPVSFQYKSSGHQDIGLIAEEVAEHLPDLVIYDDVGRPDAVKYDRISLYLLDVAKELKAESDSLKQRLEDLESAVEQLAKAKEIGL